MSEGSKSHHCTRCSSKSSVTAIASLGGHDYRPTAAVGGYANNRVTLSLRCADCGTSMSKQFNFSFGNTDTYTSCGYYCVGWSDSMTSIDSSTLRYPNAKFFVKNYAGGSWDESNYTHAYNDLVSLWNNSRFYIAYDTVNFDTNSTNPWVRALAKVQDIYKNAYWQ